MLHHELLIESVHEIRTRNIRAMTKTLAYDTHDRVCTGRVLLYPDMMMQATQKHLLKLFSKFVTMPRVCIFVICCLICAVSSRRTSAGDDEAVELQDSIAVTACTVVQAVVKANSQSNGNGQISTPWGSKTPQRISMKLGIYNYVGGLTSHANPHGWSRRTRDMSHVSVS